MKFTGYQPAIQPNVMNPPAVQAPRDPNAYGGSGEAWGSLGAAVGQANKVLQEKQDSEDAASVIDARNKIMTRLTEGLYGENGLFASGVGENAKGLTDRVTKLIQDTSADVAQNYNNRVSYALKGNLSENMANFQRIAASKELEQKQATDKANYDSGIANNNQLAALNYGVKNFVTSQIHQNEIMMMARAKALGWSGAQYEQNRQAMITQTAGGAALAALGDNNNDRAAEILNVYRKDMDQETYGKLMGQIKKKQQANTMYSKAADIVNSCKNPDGSINIEKAMKMADEYNGPGATHMVASQDGNRFWNIALKVSEKTGINPDFIYGQMMHESAGGKDPDALAYNNFAGLYGGAKGKKYANDDEFASDYADTLSRYDGLQNAQTATEFATILHNGHYFTDPDVEGYAVDVDRLARERTSGGSSTQTYALPTQGSSIDVQVANLKPGWKEALPVIGGMLQGLGVADGAQISSGARTPEHNAEVGGAENSYHIDHGNGGDAVDIVLPDGTTNEQAQEVLQKFKDSGAFSEVLFHDIGSGYHLHLGGYQGGLSAGNNTSSGHMESAYDAEENAKLKSLLQSMIGQNNTIMEQNKKQLFDAAESAIDQSSDYATATSIIENSGLQLNEKEHLKALAKNKFGIVERSSSGGSGRSSSRGGSSGGRRYNPASDAKKIEILSAKLRNGRSISESELINARNAGRALEDNGMLSEEDMNDLNYMENDESFQSQITDDIQKKGISETYNDLVDMKANPLVAAIAISKIDTIFLQNQHPDEDNNADTGSDNGSDDESEE